MQSSACPSCFWPIDEASEACPQCGTEVARAPATEPRGDAIAWSGRLLEVLLGLLVIGGVLTTLFRGAQGDPAAAEAALPEPTLVTLAAFDQHHISAGRYLSYGFTVSDPRPCTLTGRVLGVSGGSRDVQLFVFDDEAFQNWTDERAGGMRLLETERTSAASFDVRLSGPGRYHFVVSNAFSWLTGKVVEVQDLVVTCR